MSLIASFNEAWRNRDQLGDANKSRELAAFLPAALEVQESPPHPAARWLARVLMALLVLAILWACFGKVNIVATAEGKIVPSSRVKQIQPLQKGVVKKIFVSEGQFVRAGEPLLELDTTITQADQNRLQADLYATQLRAQVNTQLLLFLAEEPSGILFESLPLPEQLELSVGDEYLYKQLLWQKWQQYRSQLISLESASAKNLAEQAAIRESISKLEQTLPIVTRRTEKLKDLNEREFVSEIDYLESEQERIQQYQDLAAERQNLKQSQAASQEIQQQINLHKAEFSGGLVSELSEFNRNIKSIEEELIKASDINAKQMLYSPVDGQVQDLATNTIGGVVTDAQVLMLVVPHEEHLEAEVFLQNKDIGFVEEAMDAEIKVHTFPFTKYGVIDAKVTTMSDDATVNDDGSLTYRMQLRLNKDRMLVEGRSVRLMPGMGVTAEVKIGERRVIEFFLVPLLRHSQESLRER